MPEITQPRVVEEVLKNTNDNCLGLVGTLDESAEPTLGVLEKANELKRIVVLVGPEGGLSEKEQKITEKCGYKAVFLGENVLRVETAAIGLLAAVSLEG